MIFLTKVNGNRLFYSQEEDEPLYNKGCLA